MLTFEPVPKFYLTEMWQKN